jgi:hypothetical protein
MFIALKHQSNEVGQKVGQNGKNLINFATKISIKPINLIKFIPAKNGQKDITTINLINFAQKS